MSFSVKSGSFTLNASTGNQSVTGVGFQPVFVLFFGSLAADGAPCILTFGCATSSSARWAIGLHSEDNVGTTNEARQWETAQCIAFPLAAGSGSKVAADFVSMDADGFTINIGTTDATQYRVHYLAIGGDDLSAKVGSFTMTTGTGSLAVTGVGFQPKALLFVNGINSTSTGASAAMLNAIGAARTSSAQWALSVTAQDGVGTSEVAAKQITSACYSLSNVAGLIDEADLVSHDADGFTINKTTKDGTQRTVGYLALGGDCNFAVGAITEPATATTQTTSVGFEPDAVMFVSYGAAASESLSTSHMRLGIGVAVGASDQRVIAVSNTDAVSPTETASAVDEDECVMSVTGGTPTRAMLGELTAFTSTGWTLSYSAVTGNQNQILYLAIAGAAEATFASTGAMTGDMSQTIIGQKTFASTGAMTGSMSATQISDRTFASTGAMTGSMAASLIRDTSFDSTGAMTGTMTVIATILAEFSSTAHLMNFFSQAGEEFDVWAVTLDPGPDGAKRYAAYPFTNYNFNSFATLDGLTFAAGDGGTYVLGDFDDDGTQIDAYVQTGKSNMGTDRDKRVLVAYVVGTCDEPPLLDIEDGSGNTYTDFEGRTNAPDEPQRIKVKLARGMKGGMWGWKIRNQDGSDFDFSDLMLPPNVLTRRVD